MSNRLVLVAAFLTFAAFGVACSHHNSPGATTVCQTFGEGCTKDADCCSASCDTSTGTCAANAAMCSAAGTSCAANTDCCSVSCVNDVCQSSCTADAASCLTDGQCCSGTCGSNGTCTALSGTCLTNGNPCTQGGEACCSGLCNASGTCGPSSYCTQNGDACAHDAECCGGLCNIGSGATLGTCGQPTGGATLCTGVDGTVCGGCGDCCSRLCEVYAPTGVMICQPAEGCHVDGDLCHTNADCCGAAGTGLPGDGNVVCEIAQGQTVGICRNPQSCNPEGDVCHFQNYMTCGNSSARNDCCGAPGNSGVCKLDALGVPRCYGLASCVMSGGACSNSLDCCNNAPCVPNGSGGLVCGGTTCVAMAGQCTQTADCCNGATCVFQAGQTYGTCGAMGMCQLAGQNCNAQMPCCADAGSCTDVTTGNACGATETTGCACETTIF